MIASTEAEGVNRSGGRRVGELLRQIPGSSGKAQIELLERREEATILPSIFGCGISGQRRH
jgi:hypothetical protein